MVWKGLVKQHIEKCMKNASKMHDKCKFLRIFNDFHISKEMVRICIFHAFLMHFSCIFDFPRNSNDSQVFA